MELHPKVRQLLRKVRRWSPSRWHEGSIRSTRDPGYEAMMAREVANYRSVENVHDLPGIFHYWSNKYLVPKYQEFGFSSPNSFYLQYMTLVCAKQTGAARFISCGSGNCDTEVGLVESLAGNGVSNFVLECLDVNPHMLERGKRLAQEKQVLDRLRFTQADINSWQPQGLYQIVMANQALHHFVELETLFDKVHDSLGLDGFFLTDDMIGRNGHMRWPEALEVFNTLWRELPERYKYNHLLKRTEIEYENWDCSKEGFEGIRAQDILPLLIKKFHFELFVGFANIIDIFIDRCFGHNFDPASPSDLAFIDKVHSIDEEHLSKGAIKPTHMTAALMKAPSTKMKIHLHLTPEFCVRRPD